MSEEAIEAVRTCDCLVVMLILPPMLECQLESPAAMVRRLLEIFGVFTHIRFHGLAAIGFVFFVQHISLHWC